MATSISEIRNRNDSLLREILSYKPGKAVPCKDGRVMFPDKLIIGSIDVTGVSASIVHALRRVVHGDAEALNFPIKRQTSTEDKEEAITDFISVLMRNVNARSEVDMMGEAVQELAGKVGCMVQFIYTYEKEEFYQERIERIKGITGRFPVCAILHTDRTEVIDEIKRDLNQRGITGIYVVPWLYSYFEGDRKWQCFKAVLSDEEQFQWLNFLHGCLQEGDIALAANDQTNDQTMEVDTTQMMASGNPVQGKSTSQDNSTGGLEWSDASLAGEEPPDDEFTVI